MPTVGYAIGRALRLIQQFDPGEPAEALDASTAIPVLNDLMARIEADGIACGWSDVSNVKDELPLPREAVITIIYQLALELAPEYDATPRADVMARAGAYMNKLRRDRMVETPMQAIVDVPWPSAYRGWGDGWQLPLVG